METSPVSLPDLAVGARLQDSLLVWEIEQRTQSDGSPYGILTLANSTGRLATAPFWSSELHRIEGLSRGDVVSVIGDLSEYRGGRQLKVTSIRLVPRELVDFARLLPSIGDVRPWWQKLDEWRREMAPAGLKRAVDLFYDEPDFRGAYERCPASTGNHHAALGGLLRHTVEVGVIARAIAKTCGADWDTVLAGVLLHDIGKLEAYRYDGVFEMTALGSLVGHVVLGSLLLERRLEEEAEPPLSASERSLVHHLILSHHGKLEFGSPVTPMTLEAEVLHFADHASATTTNLADALRDASNFAPGVSVSKPIWSLDRRRVYRGPEREGPDAG